MEYTTTQVFPFYNGKHYMNPHLEGNYKVLLMKGSKTRTLINAFLHFHKFAPVQLNKVGVELIRVKNILVVYAESSPIKPDFIVYSDSVYNDFISFDNVPYYYRVYDSDEESDNFISTQTPSDGFKSKEFEYLIASINLELDAIQEHPIDVSDIKFLEFDGSQATTEMLKVECPELVEKNSKVAEEKALKYLAEFKVGVSGGIEDFELNGLDETIQARVDALVNEVNKKISDEHAVEEYKKVVYPIIDAALSKNINAVIDITKYKTINSHQFIRFDGFNAIYKAVRFTKYPDCVSERRKHFKSNGICICKVQPKIAADERFISLGGIIFTFSDKDEIINVLKELGIDSTNVVIEIYLKDKYTMGALDVKMILPYMLNEINYKLGMYLRSRVKYFV